jgi:DNA polymerase V
MKSYNQTSMLSNAELEINSSKVMSLIDTVNTRMGRNTVYFAAQGIQRTWQSRAAMKSKNYIGDWSQLMEVK